MPNRESIATKSFNKTATDNSKAKDSVDKNCYSLDVLSVGLVTGITLLIRLCTSYYPYSGENNPPMYGDYEAQRHWQEITLNLPISEWYSNSSKNDLQYWGLDYPPLTAYHSLLVAYIAYLIDPEFVKLHESRGYESSDHKYFMRLSVLVADLLVFIPAVLYFSFATLPTLKTFFKEKSTFSNKSYLTLTTLLCYPGIILIDYGHFQYNCISLGFFIASVALLIKDSIMMGSCFFVLALNYKQMELYHALPIFFYILGSCMNKKSFTCSLYFLFGVSVTVVTTFAIIWLPFLTDPQTFTDAVLRLFPFKRGIFEDKVANIWCTINVLFKLRNHFSNSHLTFICLATTACALLPSSLDLFFKPSREKFLLALINSSLAFFLCSFQVHEKSILLVAIPVLLHVHDDPFYCMWFLIISVFSMLPLYIKDSLFVAYFASLILFIVIVSWTMELQVSVEQIKKKGKKQKPKTSQKSYSFYVNALFGLSLLGVLIISICSVLIEPPKQYPDLHSLLISVYSCCHFVAFLIYFNYKQAFTTLIANKSKTE